MFNGDPCADLASLPVEPTNRNARRFIGTCATRYVPGTQVNAGPLWNPDKNNFAPRIGIAWKRKPDSRWVLRAGWGLFYNPSVYDTIAGQLVGQPPFATNQNLLSYRRLGASLEYRFSRAWRTQLSLEPVQTCIATLQSDALGIPARYQVGFDLLWEREY